MVITIVFDGTQFIYSDETAVVRLGELVEWVLISTSYNNRQLIWNIKFNLTTPFWDIKFNSGAPYLVNQSLFTTTSNFSKVHRVKIGPFRTGVVGDYKYEVELVDSNNNQQIADDDPYLNVIL